MAQDKYTDLLNQIKAAQGETKAFEEAFKKITGPGREMDKLLKSMETQLKGLHTEAQELSSSFGDMAATLANIVGEISKSDSATKSATKAYRGLLSIAQKMQYEEEGIHSYNVKQLDTLHKQAQTQLTNLKTAAERVIQEGDISKEAQAILKAYNDQLKIEQELVNAIDKRLKLEKQVEKTFGATGALIEGSSKLLSTMGFGHLSSELSELNDKLKSELRDELDKSGGSINKLGLGLKYMGKGLAGSAKIFAEGLADPLFIVGKIFDTYLDINKASVQLSHLTGQNAVKFENIGLNAASLKDSLETMAELTKQTGMNAQNIFSSKVLGQAAALKTTMGLTADEAGGLAIMSQTTGKEVDGVVESVVATTSAFNGANRAAVSQGAVLREVANTSDSIKLSLQNNPEALTKAAAAATRLGMSLQEVDNIASSLTDFQSSISNELEAELLIGKDLNLEKARELALSNDLEGVANELFKSSSDIAEFGKMNRIQQEAYAKSLGMTKDQLAKIAYQKALEKGMTEEQAAASAKVEAKDMKRIAMQENFAKALEKIAGAVAPILDIIGDILSMPLVPYLLLGAAAVYKIGGGLVGTVKSMGSLAKGALDFVKNLNMKGVTDFFGKIKDSFGAGLAGKGEAAAGGLADKAMGAGKEVPEKTGGGVKGLTDSIQKIKPSQLLAGGAALLMVAGSVYIFAKAAQEFATVSWEDMAKAGVGLIGLVAALAAIGAIMASPIGGPMLLLGAAAIVVMAGSLFLLGKAFQAIGNGMSLMEPALALVSSIGDKAAGLATVGASLLGIAAGLREIADAGTGAIPVLEKLNTLGGSKSAGEAKGKADEGSLSVVAAKLDALIAVVKAGGDVYMDSNKVGKAQVLGSYKSA
jgi:hypothetical protein